MSLALDRRRPPAEADDQDLRASLESLFGKSTEDEPARLATLEGDLLRDLPLWRVQWPASPGCSQVYNVHVPHYTHMFTTLDAASTALGVPVAAAFEMVAERVGAHAWRTSNRGIVRHLTGTTYRT